MLEYAADVFGGGAKGTKPVDLAPLHAKIGQQALELDFCHAREVIEQAFARHGAPEIVNTDQGRQFTADELTDAVLDRGCQLSMDGCGAWRDNVFVEHLWRSVKYECMYLKVYDGVRAARADIDRYIDWFNAHRGHSSLDGLTPLEAYRNLLPTNQEAA